MSDERSEQMAAAIDELRRARRIAIVAHRDPDPDTIGSAIALGMALETLGKVVTLHDADGVPEAQRFLPRSDTIRTDPPPADVDLIVTVDFGTVERAKFELPKGPRILNIDHHASNDGFGDVNFVDVTSAACAEIVSRIIDALGVRWTPEMATAALVGIMTDTGSFQFPSTDARALERGAQLRDAGADLMSITYNIFRNKRYEALKLYGFGFSRLRREMDGLLVWTEITREDFAAAEAREEDVSGLVEQVARSHGMRVALLFNEQGDTVKISCRTSAWEPSVDAAALMAPYGGGGHVRAAGALVRGDCREIREQVLAAARRALVARSARAVASN